jgi:hypothetical protein
VVASLTCDGTTPTIASSKPVPRSDRQPAAPGGTGGGGDPPSDTLSGSPPWMRLVPPAPSTRRGPLSR